MRHLISLFLVFVALPLFAQIEFPVSAPRYGPAPNDQSDAKAASNGTDFLVAWDDSRGPGAVYAQRVKSDGTILDGTGIRVPVVGSVLGVFRTGGAYTLILKNGTTTFSARINDDGEVVVPAHVILQDVFVRAAAANGTRIVLADEQGITVLDERGEFLERNVFTTPQAGWVGIGSNGSMFLLVTGVYANLQNSVNFIVLDGSGHVISTTTRYEAAGGDGPIIASDGNDYLVIYQFGAGDSIAVNVDALGTIKSATTLLRPLLAWPNSALQWTGSTYLLATLSYENEQIVVATISRDGKTIGTPRILGPPTHGIVDVPTIAWSGSEALIAWTAGQQSDPNRWEVLAALTGADGSARTNAMTVPRSANAQMSPAIAGGAVNDLVAWSEVSGIYAARTARSGVSLDPSGIFVASLRTEPHVVFDGEAYLVAWGGTLTGVHGQRIDAATGAPIGDSMALLDCAQNFDLGRDDNGVLLVAQDCRGRIVAQRVGVAGAIGDAIPISPPDKTSGNPRIAWNGSEWLLVWNNLIPLPTVGPVPIYRGQVYAERLSSGLIVLDAPIEIAVSDSNDWQPFVATDGRDFLVTWTRLWGDGNGVYARSVRANGSAGETMQFVPAIAYAHSIAWDGARYAVAYDLQRLDGTRELYLTHGSDRTPISTGPDQREVALTASGGTLRAAYSRVAPEPVYGGVYRVFVRDFAARRRAAR